jgi:hypothetical protein
LSKIFILLDKYDTAYQNEIASSVKEEWGKVYVRY